MASWPPLGGMVVDSLAQLLCFFLQLGEDALDIRPVEATFVRAASQLGGFQKRGQGAWNAIQRGGVGVFRVAFLCLFNSVPVAENLGSVDSGSLERGLNRVTGRYRGLFSENVRMAADQLTVQAGNHIRDGKVAGLAGHLGIEEHLQQKVTQLLAQVVPMTALDRVEDLVGFLQGYICGWCRSSARDPMDTRRDRAGGP